MFHVVVPAKSALDISPWYKRLFMQTYLHTCLSLYFVYEDYVSSWKRYIVQERFVLSKIKSYFLTYDGIHKCAINFNVSYVYPDCTGCLLVRPLFSGTPFLRVKLWVYILQCPQGNISKENLWNDPVSGWDDLLPRICIFPKVDIESKDLLIT